MSYSSVYSIHIEVRMYRWQERIKLWFILWAPWICVQIHQMVKTCCLMPGGWNESPPCASLLPTSGCWFLEEQHELPDVSSAVFLYRQLSQSTARTTPRPRETHTHWLTSIKGTVDVKGGLCNEEIKAYLKMLSSRCGCWHCVVLFLWQNERIQDHRKHGLFVKEVM